MRIAKPLTFQKMGKRQNSCDICEMDSAGALQQFSVGGREKEEQKEQEAREARSEAE